VPHPFALLAKGASFDFSSNFFLHPRFSRFSAFPPDPHTLNSALQTLNPQLFNTFPLYSNDIEIIT